jgi:glycosyltransferase involved in cell wall biosynthesis
MRILLVAPNPFFQERGTPIAVRILCETLCEAGHSVDLLTYHVGTDVRIPGLNILRIPRVPFIRDVPIGFSLKKLACDAVLSFKLLWQVIRNRYDVIHAVEEAIYPSLLVRPFARATVIYDMDSSMVDQLLEKWTSLARLKSLLYSLERFAIRRSDAVVAVCEALAERVRASDPEKRVLVLQDVPLEAVPGGPPADDLRRTRGIRGLLMLYVGNLERYQGIDLLLDGFARAKPATDVSLVVIGGERGDIEKYRAQSEALGLEDSVHFLGPKPIDQLSGYLRQASVLVSPRLTGNNTPMKIYSYLAAGKPVLATNIASHTQVMDASCAVLVEPTPPAMAAGIERLAADQALRERLGAAAEDLVQSKYSVAVYRRKVIDEYAFLEHGALP